MAELAAEARRALRLPDIDETGRLAAALAGLARPGDMLGLYGALGAGKTTFARAFIRARAAAAGVAVDEVPSPTFTLVQTYELPGGDIWHFDLYRLSGPDEVFELGWEEALAGGIALVEWPERLSALLPADRLDLTLSIAADEAREAELHGLGTWAARVEGIDV